MIVFDAHLDLAWNAIDWNRCKLRTSSRLLTSLSGTPQQIALTIPMQKR
jgi:hypothetical protein